MFTYFEKSCEPEPVARLRAAVTAGTDVGIRAKAVMDKGELVTDEIVFGIVEERIQASDCTNGFILDGMPRTLAQAQMLDALLARRGERVSNVLCLDVPDSVLENRSVPILTSIRWEAHHFHLAVVGLRIALPCSGLPGVGSISRLVDLTTSAPNGPRASPRAQAHKAGLTATCLTMRPAKSSFSEVTTLRKH